jgi:hypothetical protein
MTGTPACRMAETPEDAEKMFKELTAGKGMLVYIHIYVHVYV